MRASQRADEDSLPGLHGLAVLGVHLRGGDKNGERDGKIPPETYLPYVKAWLSKYNDSKVFFATDDKSFFETVFSTWPKKVQQSLVTSRSVAKDIQWQDGKAFVATRDALMDVLFLARSDFLLHSESSMSEAAIWWNLALHNRSILMFENRSRRGFRTPAEFRDTLSSLQFEREAWNPKTWRKPWNHFARGCNLI